MTLKDVALKANCSVSTVSKALKNSSEISEDAKQKILAVAKECGYLKKATTRAAVLGGFKTVILNDVNGDSIGLFDDFKRLAKKKKLTAVYVSMSEKDSLELLNQMGAFGLVLTGSNKSISDDRVFALSFSVEEAEEFFEKISNYMPERPSRAVVRDGKAKRNVKQSEKAKAPTKNKAAEEPKAPKPEPQKKEEIWLL